MKKYSVSSNIAFMLDQARNSYGGLIPISFFMALTFAGMEAGRLLMGPRILAVLESQASFRALLETIVFYGLLVTANQMVHAYLQTNALYYRVGCRIHILSGAIRKITSTDYPHHDQKDFLNLEKKVLEALSSNSEAAENIWETLTRVLQNFFLLLLYFFLFFQGLPWYILGACLVFTTLSYAFGRRMVQYRHQHREEESQLISSIRYYDERARDLTYGKEIRVFGLQSWILDQRQKWQDLYQDFYWRAEKKLLLGDLVDILLSLARNGLAYYFLLGLVMREEIAVSAFLLYLLTVSALSQRLQDFFTELNTLRREALEISTIREFLDYPEDFTGPEGQDPWELIQGPPTLTLEGVSFAYPGSEKKILDNLTLTIQGGEKLALVGLNGAGKTSLVKVLCGLYRPTEGRVLLNGVDIQTLDHLKYYELFSAVFQEHLLLATSLEENIKQGRQDQTEDKLEKVLRQADLWDRVQAFKDKEKTKLVKLVYEDAPELSGGEVQKLLLARAMYKDGPILVLDEPTAALDPIAEHELYLRYHDLTRDKTSLFISHRLASTRFCDRIILLEDGKIKEVGSHEELMKKKGSYHYLYQVQSQYYQEGEQDEEIKK